MATYRRRPRTRSILIVAILTALTFITLDSRSNGQGALGHIRDTVHNVFSPIQSATHSALAPVGNFLTGAASYGSFRSENERLRNQVAGMQAGAVAAAAALQQAQAVLKQGHLPFVGSIPTVVTQVIDSGSSNFENTVTINKGTRDGIGLGQPVVAAAGLVGDIISVSARTATVELLTDPNFVVGVRLDNVVVASAQGYGRSVPLRVTFDVPPDPGFHLAVGQPIVTSGQDMDKFPQGIPMGIVASVSSPAGAATPTATLKPLVDLSKLDYLTVELWSPS